jgi:hypothetical protein
MTSPLIGVHGRHVTVPSRVGTVIHVAEGTRDAAMSLYLLLDVPRDDGAVVDIVSSLNWTPTDPEALRKRLGTSPAREIGTAFAERLLDGMSPREIVAKVADALTGSEESWRQVLRQVGYRVRDVVRA